jgi:hypothetical protein
MVFSIKAFLSVNSFEILKLLESAEFVPHPSRLFYLSISGNKWYGSRFFQ